MSDSILCHVGAIKMAGNNNGLNYRINQITILYLFGLFPHIRVTNQL